MNPRMEVSTYNIDGYKRNGDDGKETADRGGSAGPVAGPVAFPKALKLHRKGAFEMSWIIRIEYYEVVLLL